MDNESYKLHILLDNACDSLAALVTNQGHITVQPQPQLILKSTLFECTLLQDPWDNYNDLYGCMAMDSWDPAQMNDSDPCLLAIKMSKSKYNEDNLSFESAVRRPFQAEYWKAIQVELDMLETTLNAGIWCSNSGYESHLLNMGSQGQTLLRRRVEEIQSTVLCSRQPTKRGN
jgi:hypothetical protein